MQHIIEAADFVIEHTKDVDFERFLSDKLLYGALIYYTMVIGEAGYKLSHEFTAKYCETPWSDIAGMRHHIVHGYAQIQKDMLWNVVQEDLLPLKEQVEHVLSSIDWNKWEKH